MIQNKIALITGGSRGLGKNMAINIANKGLDVILTYNSKKEEAQEVIKEIIALGRKAVALKLDIQDVTNFDSFFKEIHSSLQNIFNADKFDFLVNNAGVGAYATFSDTSVDQLESMVNIHFKGPFLLTQKALLLMNDGGGIINISSGLARFALPGYAAYASMKAAMETLTKYEAKELGPRKIKVNVVAPGAIETDFGGGAVRDNAQLNGYISSITALGRAGLPNDIGPVVAFLCTEDAAWINAQRIEVSGGMML